MRAVKGRAKAAEAAARKVVLRDKVGKKIAIAFRVKGGKWRTLGGIARESGLSEEAVIEYVRAKKGCFVRAPVSPGGKELYAITLAAVPASESREGQRKVAAG